MEKFIVIEGSDVFARAVRDPVGEALASIEQRLLEPVAGADGADLLAARVQAKGRLVVETFRDLLEQQRVLEGVERSVESQLARADSRYNELPDSLPGQWSAIDRVRQHILTEKQGLLRELRAGRLQHAKELARLRERLIDAHAQYLAAARLLDSALSPPHLDDLIGFLPLATQGEEVVVLSTPDVARTMEARIP